MNILVFQSLQLGAEYRPEHPDRGPPTTYAGAYDTYVQPTQNLTRFEALEEIFAQGAPSICAGAYHGREVVAKHTGAP